MYIYVTEIGYCFPQNSLLNNVYHKLNTYEKRRILFVFFYFWYQNPQ